MRVLYTTTNNTLGERERSRGERGGGERRKWSPRKNYKYRDTMGNVYMHGHAQRATNQRLDCGLHSHLLGLLLAWMDAVRPIVRAFPPPKSCMPGIYTDVMAIPEVCLENRFGGFMAHAQEQATNYRTNKTKRKKKGNTSEEEDIKNTTLVSYFLRRK